MAAMQQQQQGRQALPGMLPGQGHGAPAPPQNLPAGAAEPGGGGPDVPLGRPGAMALQALAMQRSQKRNADRPSPTMSRRTMAGDAIRRNIEGANVMRSAEALSRTPSTYKSATEQHNKSFAEQAADEDERASSSKANAGRLKAAAQRERAVDTARSQQQSNYQAARKAQEEQQLSQAEAAVHGGKFDQVEQWAEKARDNLSSAGQARLDKILSDTPKSALPPVIMREILGVKTALQKAAAKAEADYEKAKERGYAGSKADFMPGNLPGPDDIRDTLMAEVMEFPTHLRRPYMAAIDEVFKGAKDLETLEKNVMAWGIPQESRQNAAGAMGAAARGPGTMSAEKPKYPELWAQATQNVFGAQDAIDEAGGALGMAVGRRSSGPRYGRSTEGVRQEYKRLIAEAGLDPSDPFIQVQVRGSTASHDASQTNGDLFADEDTAEEAPAVGGPIAGEGPGYRPSGGSLLESFPGMPRRGRGPWLG